MIYDVDYFLSKFSAIPEELFCVGKFIDEFSGQRCAQGHCFPSLRTNTAIDQRLDIAGRKNFIVLKPQVDVEIYHLLEIFESAQLNIADVNNGTLFTVYQQPTPKQRILAALYDIKRLQTKDIDTGAKRERIVYVAIPETIKEQASELILS